MRKRVKNTVFFRNLSEDSSADASADAPAIINIRNMKSKKLWEGKTVVGQMAL